MTTTQAQKMRDAMSDVEFMLLEQGLYADAGYIADCVKRGNQAEADRYMNTSNYLERMRAWKSAR